MTEARSYLYAADRERNKADVKTWYHKFNNLGKKSIQLQQGNPSVFRIQCVRQINWNVSYTYRFLSGWIKATECDSYCLNFWGWGLDIIYIIHCQTKVLVFIDIFAAFRPFCSPAFLRLSVNPSNIQGISSRKFYSIYGGVGKIVRFPIAHA